MIRFFLDAIDGLHGVGEPDADTRWAEKRLGRRPTVSDLRVLTGCIRGWKLGKLVGSACVLGSFGATMLGPTLSTEDLLGRWIGVVVFSFASPYVLGSIGGWWADEGDDDDFDDPAPMGGT